MPEGLPRSVLRTPLVLLPVMKTPFERIPMNIVGPLPKSQVGNRFVLVIMLVGPFLSSGHLLLVPPILEKS